MNGVNLEHVWDGNEKKKKLYIQYLFSVYIVCLCIVYLYISKNVY